MRFTRDDKTKLVDDMRARFERSDAAFLTEYKGIKAVDLGEFRQGLRDASLEFKIVRNTLAKRAVVGTDSEHLAEHIKGPVAFVFSYSDPAVAAKKLTEFAKDKDGMKILVGSLGARPLGPDEIRALAELPGKDVLLGKMLGSMNAPLSGFVGVLSGVPRKFLYVLSAIKADKG